MNIVYIRFCHKCGKRIEFDHEPIRSKVYCAECLNKKQVYQCSECSNLTMAYAFIEKPLCKTCSRKKSAWSNEREETRVYES